MSTTDHHPLIEIDLEKLRPTQATVGLAEVAAKRSAWASLDRKGRRALLRSHWFPAVLGPRGRHYIVDHHHLGLALLEEGVEQARVMVLADLSYLELAVFWRVMEHHDWAHPFDARGERQPWTAIPKRLAQLTDDPHRSLAGFLRTAGGYAKDASPYAEFLWADYLRPLITEERIRASMDDALFEAIGLAKSPLARYLPGWTGVSPSIDATAR